jgi:hypothetical protein
VNAARTIRPAETSPPFRAALPIAAITPAAVQARLSYRLRRLIGPGRRMTLVQAAAATGINARTLKAYFEGRACPNVARYGRLLRVFGPEVGIEMATMIGWEPRAANPDLPRTEDLRALRDAIAQAIRAVDIVLAHGSAVSDDAPAPPPATGR